MPMMAILTRNEYPALLLEDAWNPFHSCSSCRSHHAHWKKCPVCDGYKDNAIRHCKTRPLYLPQTTPLIQKRRRSLAPNTPKGLPVPWLRVTQDIGVFQALTRASLSACFLEKKLTAPLVQTTYLLFINSPSQPCIVITPMPRAVKRASSFAYTQHAEKKELIRYSLAARKMLMYNFLCPHDVLHLRIASRPEFRRSQTPSFLFGTYIPNLQISNDTLTHTSMDPSPHLRHRTVHTLSDGT